MFTTNFPFIPFLLGTSLFIDNVTEWRLGPDYVFVLNRFIIIYTATVRHIVEESAAIVKCQPKLSDALICCIQNITFHYAILNYNNYTYNTSFELIDTEQMFVMKFSKRGLQYVIAELNSNLGLDIIKWIVEQFNVGIDLNIESAQNMTGYENVKAEGLYVISSFTGSENMWKESSCNTSYLITCGLHTEFYSNTSDSVLTESSHSKIRKNYNYDFQFIVLLIPYLELITRTFSIDRHRATCTKQPLYIKLRKDVWDIMEVTRYFNKMEVKHYTSKSKFGSYTHLEGRLHHQNFNNEDNVEYFKEEPMFKETVHLNLIDVKPASKKLFINNQWIFQDIDMNE